MSSSRTAIAEMTFQDSNDFEALTSLYRKIFRFLLDFAPMEKGAAQDRAVEREVAAALESVFPRIGLKSFVQLSFEEKSGQLMELARIVFGIRLFNRYQKRGGTGIEPVDEASEKLCGSLEREINKEADFFTDVCNKYQSALVRGHLQQRKNDIRMQAALDEGKEVEEEEDGGVNPYLLTRWAQELANRRQYLTFVRSLQDEILASIHKITDYRTGISAELVNLAGLIGGKTSVPKEQVYPKFDSLATMWLNLWEEFSHLQARNTTYQVLRKFRTSFVPLLTDAAFTRPSTTAEAKDEKAEDTSESIAAGYQALDAADAKRRRRSAFAQSKKSGIDDDVDEEFWEESSQAEDKDEDEPLETTSASGATLLSVDTTPDFMLLPLELQGFCPWTIVHANGLLVPGRPALGVIRFENLYYVCEHKVAVKAFMANPSEYVQKIRDRAAKNPEYIHLLRLQNYFPSASISRLIERPDFDEHGGKPMMKHASTGTPTHFVESRIDPNYHWNEWELRRRVLKVANLKNCATISQQTDLSHFRRENETQVYEPRVKGTQTKKDSGTNPPQKTTYVAGLRGKLPAESKAVSRYIDAEPGAKKAQSRVVTLTLDL